MTANIYSGPVQAPDESSDTGWSPIDTDLEGSSGRFITENTDLSIEFSDGGDGALASVGKDGRTLAMGWQDNLPTPTISGDTATYPDVRQGVAVVLEANPAGFEVRFLVDSPSNAPGILNIPLQLGGLEASFVEGGLVLTDNQGHVVGGADPALMWGSEINPETGQPTVVAPVPTALVEGRDGLVLRLTPDAAFFKNPDVTYPVTIDPAVNLTLTLDTYADSANPTTHYGSSTQLRVGLGGGGALYRSFLKFDRAAIAGQRILTASLSVYETAATSACNAPTQVDLYSVEQIPVAAITWNNQPVRGALYASQSSSNGYSPSCPAGNITLSSGGAGGATLAELVQQWAEATMVPAMVELRAHDETDAAAYKEFLSSEGTVTPVLSVTYDSAIEDPDLDAVEYSLQYNVTLSQARQRISIQDSAGDLDATLETEQAALFSGLWIEHEPDFRVIVRFTASGVNPNDYTSDPNLEAVIEVQLTTYSLAQLRSDLDTVLENYGETVAFDGSVDVKGNEVELWTASQAAYDTLIQASLPQTVVVQQVDYLLEPKANIYAGLGITGCTTGFSVYEIGTGVRGVSTAAHCGNLQYYMGDQLPYEAGYMTGSLDIQWHRAPGFTVKNWAYDGIWDEVTPYYRKIWYTKHRNNMAIGTRVCKYGQISHFGCGAIDRKDIALDYIPFPNRTFILVREPVRLIKFRDSGMPVYRNNTAYGMGVAGTDDRDSTPPFDMVFMAANYFSALGVLILVW